MKELTFDEWVKRYVDKTGDKVYIPEGFQLAFDPAHGIFCFAFGEFEGREWLEICCSCIDSWKWLYDSVAETVINNKLAGVIASTNRNPKAFCKLTGAKSREMPDGSFLLIWEVQNVQL